MQEIYSRPREFNLELQAIKRIWDMGYTNLHLMIPFVRVPWEIIQIKELVKVRSFVPSRFPSSHHGRGPYCALNLKSLLKLAFRVFQLAPMI